MKVYRNEEKNRELALKKCLEGANANKNEVLIKEMEIPGNLLRKTKYNIIVIPKEEIKIGIKHFIKDFCRLLTFKVEIGIIEKENIFKVDLNSDHDDFLIGRDGKNLNALETLLKQYIFSKTGFSIKIHLDISNYRAKKVKRLEDTVKQVAREVTNSKIEVKLDPMNSYERRIVHNLINNYSFLKTRSEGETPNRYVVIFYKQD